ncbi:MAG: stage II sporulation protein R [Oscillospiraceae bacterium]|nr:stage II sporulation protein R [Oscillospiraceae bacterium]
MKKALHLLAILFCAVFAANLMHTEAMLEQIEHSVIRLHILANSDSTADQTQKLLVRDALVQAASEWIPEGATWAEGCEALRARLPEIQQRAEETLRAAGCDAPVQVSFGEAAFPVRSYGDITLPAGNYQALRVEIGAGKGQNWWCVMYPALCLPAAEAEASLPEGEARRLTEQPEKYEIRLKCVDALRAVFRRLRSL